MITRGFGPKPNHIITRGLGTVSVAPIPPVPTPKPKIKPTGRYGGPLSPIPHKRERIWNIRNPISKHLSDDKNIIAYILKQIEDGKPISSSIIKQISHSTSIKSNLLKQLYKEYDINNPFIKSNIEIYKELKSKTKNNKLIRMLIGI